MLIFATTAQVPAVTTISNCDITHPHHISLKGGESCAFEVGCIEVLSIDVL